MRVMIIHDVSGDTWCAWYMSIALKPDLGHRNDKSCCGEEKPKRWISILQGKISSISSYDAPKGRLLGAGGGFPECFPLLIVKEFIASHLIPVIFTVDGEASLAAADAADCDRPEGGGAVVRDHRVSSTAGLRVRVQATIGKRCVG